MALMTASKRIPEFVVHSLLKSPTVTIRDTYCQGSCRERSAEECTTTTQLVFPYRGVYVRHVGHDQTVAEAHQVLGPRTTHAAGASIGRQRLVDRVKLVLASDLARRWTLAEISAEVRGSPVYLTQVFQQVEGLPLYRYQLRLRLARALDLLAQYDDLTALSLDLGFSSHSHFSAVFRQAYGRSPSEVRRSALLR